MSKTLRYDSCTWEDEDDCLAACAAEMADTFGLDGWDLNPRWEDERTRDAILVDVPDWVVE